MAESSMPRDAGQTAFDSGTRLTMKQTAAFILLALVIGALGCKWLSFARAWSAGQNSAQLQLVQPDEP
jgi:hypothetical protein